MSDETLRGKVIMVFASNRPDLMDPAIKRSGRMDAIIPVMLPSEAERAGIIAAQANNQGVRLDTLACQIAAEKTPNWSSADLGALIRKAGRYTKDCVTTIEIDRALKAIRPSGQDTAQFFSLLAIEACNDNDLLPPEYAALLNDRTKLTEAIQAADPAPRPRGERVAREDRF